MIRKLGLMLLAAILIAALLPHTLPARAQDPDGHTTYQLNLRAGPGTTYTVITVLDANTGLMFEGRTADLAWLLVRTEDGTRGWVASLYLVIRDGYGSPASLPVSDEVIPVAPPPAPSDSSAAAQSIPANANVTTLENTPVISGVGPRANEIFQSGLAQGNRPNVFTIVGGCNSLARGFMQPFGFGNYDLGSYSYLQPTIDYFRQTPVDGMPNSFVHKGVAVAAGYTAMALTDPAWADPAYCQGGESPLTCEYRRSKPTVAFIMLGILDVYWFTPAQFEANLSRIVEESIEAGVIPVLTTFPTTSGEDSENYGGVTSESERAVFRAEFNTIVVNLAREYGVPLLNLWRAARATPRSGFIPDDQIHFWEPDNAALWGDLENGPSQCVFPTWNLSALQMLDALRVSVLGG
jgi:uncharacterized protein YraI